MSAVLGEGIDLVVRPKTIRRCTLLLIGAVILQPLPPAKAIFSGIAILLAVCLSSSDPIYIFIEKHFTANIKGRIRNLHLVQEDETRRRSR
jgi:hypothetical protein